MRGLAKIFGLLLNFTKEDCRLVTCLVKLAHCATTDVLNDVSLSTKMSAQTSLSAKKKDREEDRSLSEKTKD